MNDYNLSSQRFMTELEIRKKCNLKIEMDNHKDRKR